MSTMIDMPAGERERLFGARLRELRIVAGHSQEELARLANLSRSAVRSLEGGDGSSLSTVIKVLRALGRDDWLDTLEVPSAAFNPIDLLAENRGRRASGPPRVRRGRRARIEGQP